MMFSGITAPSGPSAPSGFQRVAQPRQPEHLGLVEILDRIEAAVHVAIERGVADRHFRLVAGGHHHQAELVGDRHQDRAARARLQIFLGDVARQSGEQRRERRLEAFDRRRDRQDLVAHAERLGAGGGIVERFLRGELVGQHHAAHALGAERIDRHRRAQRGIDAAGQAEHDAGKAVLVDVVAQAQHAGGIVGVARLRRRRPSARRRSARSRRVALPVRR